MGVFKKGKKWFNDWRDRAGRRHRKSHNTETDANRADRSIKKWKRHDGPKPRGFALTALVEQFLSTKTSTAPNHQAMLRRTLTRLLATLGRRDPAQLETQHFANFRASLRKFAPQTRWTCDVTARAFLKWCHRNGHVPEPPDELYPNQPYTPPRRTVVVDPATATLIEQNATGPVLLLYMLGRYAGMRITEAARAIVADYNPTAGTLAIRSVKNHPIRTVDTNPALSSYLTSLTAKQPAGSSLSALANPRGHALKKHALWCAWDTYRQTIRAHHVNPHDLRRTLATELSQHCSVATLMEIMGWKNVRSAIPYLVVNPAQKRAAIDRAWANNPRALDTMDTSGEPQ